MSVFLDFLFTRTLYLFRCVAVPTAARNDKVSEKITSLGDTSFLEIGDMSCSVHLFFSGNRIVEPIRKNQVCLKLVSVSPRCEKVREIPSRGLKNPRTFFRTGIALLSRLRRKLLPCDSTSVAPSTPAAATSVGPRV